jgi:hypothetical protein
MSMSVGERDKTMSKMARIAAEAFCDQHTSPSDSQGTSLAASIRNDPKMYLEHTVPYLTVRALHRHEEALVSLEADSQWIKRLTFVLVGLTIVLAYYAFRLDTVIHSLQSNESPTPSPTRTATATQSPAN